MTEGGSPALGTQRGRRGEESVVGPRHHSYQQNTRLWSECAATLLASQYKHTVTGHTMTVCAPLKELVASA